MPERNAPDLYREIRGRRTMAQFGKAMGTSAPVISRYESGERNPEPGPLAFYFSQATPAQQRELLTALRQTEVGRLLEAARRMLVGAGGNGHPPEAD